MRKMERFNTPHNFYNLRSDIFSAMAVSKTKGSKIDYLLFYKIRRTFANELGRQTCMPSQEFKF